VKKKLAFALAAAALGVAFLRWSPGPWLALLAATAAALLFEPAALRRAWTGRTLVSILLASGVTGVAVAWSASAPAGIRAGLAMLLRVLVVVVVASLASRHVDHESWRRALARLGLQRVGLACGLALNAMPHLVEAWRDAWIALAVRRRRRHPRWRDLPALAETLLAHAARLVDETAVAAALRGSLALGPRPPVLEGCSPLVVVLTGRSGAGKTPAAERLAGALAAGGVPVFGFLQPPLWLDGRKAGFDIVDIRSGARAVLGRRRDAEGQHGTPFVFHEEGFALARKALAAPPRDAVLVVDEIGPVELRGEGHWPAVAQAWKAARPRAAVLTLRRQLIPAFLGLLGATDVVVVDAEDEPDAATAALAALSPALPPGPR